MEKQIRQWQKFDEMYEVDNSTDRPPFGKYVVEVKDICLKSSKKGEPMIYIWFKIDDSISQLNDDINENIFYNQVIIGGKQRKIAMSIIRTLLKPFDLDIYFNSYEELGRTIMEYSELIKQRKYVLEFNQSERGNLTYRIEL